jgi:hypothetical protein
VTKHSRYSVKVIMEGISQCSLGYPAAVTVGYLKRRFGILVPEKTLRHWYMTHKPICTHHAIRDQIKRRIEPAGLIESTTSSTGRCVCSPSTTVSWSYSSHTLITAKKRHETLQRFMLLNDSATSAWRSRSISRPRILPTSRPAGLP